LQHLSTLAGAAAGILFLFKSRLISGLPSNGKRMSWRQKLAFWAMALVIAIAGGLAAILIHRTWPALVNSNFTHLRPSITAFGLGSWAAFFYYLCFRGALRRLSGS